MSGYLCPRCRDEGADHDCAQPSKLFQLEGTLRFPVYWFTHRHFQPGQTGSEAAQAMYDLLMSEPAELLDALREAVNTGEITLKVQPVFVDLEP